MPFLLGPLLDLLLIAMISRHRMFWLVVAVMAILGVSVLGDMTEHGPPGTWNTSMELVGGSK